MFFFYKKYALIELQKQKGWETYARNKKFNNIPNLHSVGKK